MQVGTDACSKLDGTLSVPGLKDAFSKSWRPAQKKFPGRLVLLPSCHPVLSDVLGDAEQCPFLLLRPEHRMGEHGRRMDIRIRSSLLDID